MRPEITPILKPYKDTIRIIQNNVPDEYRWKNPQQSNNRQNSTAY
jgi:hypothetical protein